MNLNREYYQNLAQVAEDATEGAYKPNVVIMPSTDIDTSNMNRKQRREYFRKHGIGKVVRLNA